MTDVCGTLYNLSLPLLVHDFGRREGSWMMDPVPRKGQRNKIYLTNFFYGNSLLEFKSMARFKYVVVVIKFAHHKHALIVLSSRVQKCLFSFKQLC